MQHEFNRRHPLPDSHTQALPFIRVSNRQIRLLHGRNPESRAKLNTVIARYGNYLASFTLRQRREEAANDTLISRCTSLEGFLDLPMDIIYEAFGWLHPIELYNLLRTSEDIRLVLLDSSSTSMWQASYRNHPNIPGLPSDLSDYAWWTTFIFGPDTCQQCGCAGAIPNFCFRWRMCDSCMLERCALIDHLTLPSRFLRRCSVLHFEQLFVVILPVSKQSSAFSWFSPQVYSKREFKSRVNEIIRRLERLKDESAIPLFLDVCIQQTKLKLHRMRDIHTAEMWVQGVWNSVEAVYQADVNKSVERWKAHLSKKYPGPVIQDLTATIRSLVERESLRFSTKVAKKYFAELQIEITYLMRPYENLRRERQRQRLQRLYGKVIDECAFSFVDAGIGGLNPGWQHFATTLRQEETTNLESLLESESKRDTFSPDMRSRIHAFVGEWILAEKRKLVDELAETPCLDNCTLSGGKEDAIYLACAAFRCVGGPHPPNTRTNTFFGWRQAHEHFRCERQDDDFRAVDLPRYEFNEPVYKAVVFLLRSLGLDPNVTRCSDIDRLDPIFLCLSCPEVHGKTRSNGRLPIAWRDSVLHLFDHWNAHYRTDHSEEVHLAVMSESMKQIFRKHSQPCKPQRHPQMSCWRCCHCPARHHSRKDVLSHLKLDHSATSAMPHEDYFVLPTNLCKYDVPSNAFRVTIGCNLSCCRCPDSRQSKLWYFRDLRKHLKDLHRVTEAIQGEDYIFVQPYAGVIKYSRHVLVEEISSFQYVNVA